MKKAIREYIELTEAEKKVLWENATFVFDTNVFLNLYRYSSKTSVQLLDAFEQLKTQIWMPYQVAYEFCKDRYKVISETNKRYTDLKKASEDFICQCISSLRLERDDPSIISLKEYLSGWMDEQEKKALNISITSDSVFETILTLFDGKTGKPCSEEDKAEWEKEGEKRYSEKMPPGYKDATKKGNSYGDLFVWKEILNYAKDNKRDIIFVTHDQKEDWWNECQGKTIGPRIELRKEFYEYTGQKFHMYSMKSFLSYFSSVTGNTIDADIIDEVNVTADASNDITSDLQEMLSIPLPAKGRMSSLDKLQQRKKIQAQIKALEEKNRKRKQQINHLQTLISYKQHTPEIQTALERNINNYERDEARINNLRLQLNYLLF